MAQKSMGWYIENNDFEGAVERWLKTNARWKMEWFDTCKEIFDNCKEWAKTYIVNPVNCSIQRITKVITKRKTKYSDTIQIAEGIDLLDQAKQKCYLFTFFDENDNLICSKIGTTTRTVTQRLKEELRSNTYKKNWLRKGGS